MSTAAWLSRRAFLTPWRRWREELDAPEPAPPWPPPFLRPPGALDERAFLEACERCGACREACPETAIVPLGPAYGEALAGTPGVLPRARACALCADLPCARACPSGALRPVALARVRMGLARVDEGVCFAAQGQPCDYCLVECRVEGALRFEGTRTPSPPLIDPERCTGCGLCAFICPSTPAAITVMPVLGERVRPLEVRDGTADRAT